MQEVVLLIRTTMKSTPIIATTHLKKADEIAVPPPRTKIPMKRDAVVRGDDEGAGAVDVVVALKAKLRVDRASSAKNVGRVRLRGVQAAKNRPTMRMTMI